MSKRVYNEEEREIIRKFFDLAEIDYMYPNTYPGKTLATFTLSWPGFFQVKKCALRDSVNGIFYAWPSRPEEKDGKHIWISYAFMEDRGILEKLENLALEALEKKEGSKTSQPPPPHKTSEQEDIPF